jgi:CheY-like chemotaxis protein
VKLYTELGHGLSVKLYLPRWFGEGVADRLRTEPVAPPRAQNAELVLVVKDDPQVLKVTVGMLKELGYRTLEADGGDSALKQLDSHPEARLLLTDIVMRDMNGRRLAEQALQRRPGLKVLFATGYTRNAVVHNGIVDPGVELIVKPFTLEALAHKVAQILGRPLRRGG